MEIGSKLGIYKLKLVTPTKGEPFFLATVFEKVYNSKNSLCPWETAFYNNVYIFDTSLDLQEADRSLNINTKDKFSFDNIANKQNSIIRVLDLKYEKHTQWKNKEQVKDDYGKPITQDIFYLTKIAEGTKTWRSEDGKFKLLKRKFEAQKLKIAEQKRKNLDKDVEYHKIIKKIQSEKHLLERENKKLREIIEKQQNSVKKANFEVKQSNKQRMVARRSNTIANNELKKAKVKIKEEKQKVLEAKQEVKKVKKMREKEIIKKAEIFSSNFMFSDMEE